jgi:hypothetical protein
MWEESVARLAAPERVFRNERPTSMNAKGPQRLMSLHRNAVIDVAASWPPQSRTVVCGKFFTKQFTKRSKKQ